MDQDKSINKSVSVAMCTYNGKAYIGEQLDSILAQTLQPAELVVCDDGSTDGTLEIIRKFAETAPFEVNIICNSKNIGVIANFSNAIEACKHKYIALSDQDDVWLPDKLEITLRKVLAVEEEYGESTPILVHTDLEVVDSNLQTIAKSMMKSQGDYSETNMINAQRVLCAQNYVTGCTVMMNTSLKQITCPIPNGVAMHDWWFALIASAQGRIGYVDKASILYRQHGNNQVGISNRIKRHFYLVTHPSMMMKNMKASLQQNKLAVQCPIAQSFYKAVLLKDWGKILQLRIHKQTGIFTNIAYYVTLLFIMLTTHDEQI